MEARSEKFWLDAKELTGDEAKWQKELKSLRRFLQRNQEQRFTDMSQNRLFEAMALYVHKLPNCPEVLELVKDGLAMPFTVFSTKHKKKMLRWHDELVASIEQQENSQLGQPVDLTTCAKYLVLGVEDDGYLTLMEQQSGDIVETLRLETGSPFYSQVQQALQEGQSGQDDEQKEIVVYVSNSTIIHVDICSS